MTMNSSERHTVIIYSNKIVVMYSDNSNKIIIKLLFYIYLANWLIMISNASLKHR